MDNYITASSLEYERYFEYAGNEWHDPRELLSTVIAAQERRLESYARHSDAKPEIVARNRAELEKLIVAYWCLLPLDLPTYKLLNDLLLAAKKQHPRASIAMAYIPIRFYREDSESVFIDLCSKKIV